MRINYWNIAPGDKTGQAGREQKIAEGMAFIERLKADGETILSVDQEPNRIKITLADPWEV